MQDENPWEAIWPDQRERGLTPNGRKRAIGYNQIMALMKTPRDEKILKTYDNANAARQMLHSLRKLKEHLPGGVWHFYIRDIVVKSSGREILVYALFGVFFVGANEPFFLLQNPKKASHEEWERYQQLMQIVKNKFNGDLSWRSYEEQMLLVGENG